MRRKEERGSWETLNSNKNQKECCSAAGSPRGIMTVILQCISSYSAETALLDERDRSLANHIHSNKIPWRQAKQKSGSLFFFFVKV